jgi:hypothetical protein
MMAFICARFSVLCGPLVAEWGDSVKRSINPFSVPALFLPQDGANPRHRPNLWLNNKAGLRKQPPLGNSQS